MRVKRFEDLVVWQKSTDLSVAIYRSTSSGPFARDFGLRDQIRRAAVSVMSNIAEGFGRYSRSELRQYLSIVVGR
jgi:four helix bundle protein